MDTDDALFEWREREFLFENGLGCYEFYVDATAEHEHRVLGTVPTRVACWLTFHDSSSGGKAEFDFCMQTVKERDESLEILTSLRDSLSRMIAAINEASELVQDRWKAESDAASE